MRFRSLLVIAAQCLAIINFTSEAVIGQEGGDECTPTVCSPGTLTHIVCIDPATILDVNGRPISDSLADGQLLAVNQLCASNLIAAAVLSKLDIDQDGVTDNAPDTDGDGLPDNWELGGVETQDVNGDGLPDDRVVFYAAPSPIVPGTPPTPLFTRRAVASSAMSADSDGDGISDFAEVFGLMFIDDDGNGVLDLGEWNEVTIPELNIAPNGLPNPGEFPIDQSRSITDLEGVQLLHDFDGFVFTDPTNPDTDGDGDPDGSDIDPLINPRSFGIDSGIIVRFEAEDNSDIDKDGLGNGMDMGNDLVTLDGTGVPRNFQEIDNPANLIELLDLFREDLLNQGVVPEAAIEDLLGADWDGNGLWRTTDVRSWSIVIDPVGQPDRLPPDEFFIVDGQRLYAPQTFEDIAAIYNDDPNYNKYGDRGIGLGWQRILEPPATSSFIPDRRVWAILYAWRVPGFDIDGDGFIGIPNIAANAPGINDTTANAALTQTSSSSQFVLTNNISLTSLDRSNQPLDDRIVVGVQETEDPVLNGVIEVPELVGLGDALRGLGCGAVGFVTMGLMTLGIIGAHSVRRLRK